MQNKNFCTSSRLIPVICAALLLAAVISVQAQTFTVLHTFNGKNGAGPVGTLVLDGAGNIYGTTAGGGAGKCYNGCGAAFMLNKVGKQVGVFSFNGADGYGPEAGLLRDTSGNFYGTTILGGDTNCNPPNGCGTVFKGSRTGKETVLHKFTGPPDGWLPQALLVEDPQGNLYGTTYQGGVNTVGTIFKIDPAGNETILYSFVGPPEGGDGAFPHTGLTRDTAGNLYGTAAAGGAFGEGAIYELDASGQESLLYSFEAGSDGAQPDSVLLLNSHGNLYGTTADGGNGECGGTGCGTVFELWPQSGGKWTETVLYRFCSILGCADGQEPAGGLVRDSSGNIYGTTYSGGAYRSCNGDGCGTVFKLDTTGTETVLHSFTGGKDGALPAAGLTMDGSGDLFGTTEEGGVTCLPSLTCGVVFKIVP